MSPIEESLQLSLAPELTAVEPAVARVLAWFTLQGVPAYTRARIELPLVEALNNAVEHGCHPSTLATAAPTEPPRARLVAQVTASEAVVTVTDPGHFTPTADWIDLPADPLAEGGRGGFIINSSTDSWAHANSPAGHTLTLRWHTQPLPGRSLLSAASSDDTLDKLTADLANSFETLLGLTHFTSLLATTQSFDQLLAQVHARLGTMLPHQHFIIRFIQGDSLVHHPVGRSTPTPTFIGLDRSSFEGACALDRRPFTGPASQLAPGDPLHACGVSLCLMPIDFGGKTLGTLAATRLAHDSPFTGGEVELLQAVGDFLGIARATENLWQEKAKRLVLEQEVQVAANIQRSLLPASFPPSHIWDIWGACRPAREVGGDYFDVVHQPDGGLLLLVADVMGKGVPAALLATMLRSSLRAVAPLQESPDAILTAINRQLYPDLVNLGMFITAVLVALPPRPGAPVRFANAGHSAPATLTPAGPLTHPGGDVPLGVLPDTAYHAHPLPIGGGERLFLYTDGCYEVERPDGQLLGEPAFIALADARRQLPLRTFVDTLLNPAALFLDPAAIADDRTLLVAELRP